MRPVVLILMTVCFAGLGAPALADDEPSAPQPATETLEPRLKDHVEWLAHPDRGGRKDWEDREACAAWLGEQFAEVGLTFLPGLESYAWDPELKEGAAFRVRDVLGWIPGSAVTEENPGPYLIVSAPYDHLGKRGEELLPGANSEASAVAALIEIARELVGRSKEAPLPVSIVFIAADLHVSHQLGMRAFTMQAPIPLDDCIGMLSMEMVGRSLGDLGPGVWIVVGGENSAELDSIAREMGAPEDGNSIHVGSYFHIISADYAPFRENKIPYLYLSAGASIDWHQPGDSPDKIQWPHLAARVRWTTELVSRIAASETRPTWREEGAPRVDEVKALRDVVVDALDRVPRDSMPAGVWKMMERLTGKMDEIIASGEVTPQKRAAVRGTLVAFMQFAPLLKRARDQAAKAAEQPVETDAPDK